ncbi:hypothetical protein OIY81_221 [Cryptosporidium canis]|uniref:DEAD-box RNA helicase Q domain-containing protein n=1 Tax=Cryptosporidium canis TaxID=195482 RepID=A0ABQ8P8C3_9CRYT|nr:hypothetical protein OJ252_1387 [Cryptosporidium canis]KAJ1615117.1 hypothetical protein OIY81_221 [Cryptosporidium canis]
MSAQNTEELVDYEEEETTTRVEDESRTDEGSKVGRGNYVAIHASGFRDFFLKPELIRAIGDAGFEHPSEVQHETIPHAITGVDILCQAKSVPQEREAAGGLRGYPDSKGRGDALQVHAEHPDRHSGESDSSDSTEEAGDGGRRSLCVGRVRQVSRVTGHEKRRPGHLHEHPEEEAGDDVQRNDDEGHQGCVQEVHAEPRGDFRGRRDEADAARTAAVLCEAGRVREEQKAQRPAGPAGVQPGDHLCKERLQSAGSPQALDGVQLPVHLHPRGSQPAGENLQVPAVQEL